MALAEAATSLAETDGGRTSSGTFAEREVIGDRYIVVKWLATGGMGEVYEVQDTWIDERIALKTIVAAIADDPHALSRLKAEVRIARRVTHANVCRVYDLGFHQRGGEQIAFLTMELLNGVTLRRLLAEKGPLSLEAARPLIVRMAEALRHAHSAGIVHRDFKSDNVMVADGPPGEAPRVVVMDFGLARQSLVGLTQPLTPQSRTVFGTLDYMSPEQIMGRPATPASDLYSLGVVIYELLTGHLPFEGESPLARALRRVTEKAPPLAKVLPSPSAELEACVAKCLQPKPEARFATVDDLLAVLGPEAPNASASRSRRSKLLPSLLLGAIVAAFAVLGSRPPPPPGHGTAAVRALDPAVQPEATMPSVAATPPAADIQLRRTDFALGDRERLVEPVASASKTTPVSRNPNSLPPRRVPPTVVPAPEPAAGPAALSVRATAAGPDDATRREPAIGTGDALLNPFASRARVLASPQSKLEPASDSPKTSTIGGAR
jgi:serine/threonine protein kinase